MAFNLKNGPHLAFQSSAAAMRLETAFVLDVKAVAITPPTRPKITRTRMMPRSCPLISPITAPPFFSLEIANHRTATHGDGNRLI